MLENTLPDLIINFGPRSLISLIGIILIIVGVWRADRRWDEKGTASYEKEKSKNAHDIVISEEDLDDAFPFPTLFILGWVVFAFSYLFSVDGSTLVAVNPYTIGAIIFSLLLAAIAGVPMGDAVRKRKKDKKMKLSMMFVLSWIGLTITSGFATGGGAASFIFGGIGAVCIIISMKLLWKYRKMGDSWEQEGRPNPNPIVYNMGGPLFVFGWFCFWIAMSSTSGAELSGEGLSIFFNLRTALAFFAGCGMVPIVMMVDYAHDEGGKYVGFGTDGRFFGRFFESPIPFIALWILFGLSAFISLDGGFLEADVRMWLLLLNCIAIGITAGILIQTALYKGDMDLKNKFSMLFVVLLLFLALNIGLGKGIGLYLAIAGVVFVVAGQKTVFGDRKRGDYWMKNNEVNPNPIVYSRGELFFMTGWILLSLAVSLPISS